MAIVKLQVVVNLLLLFSNNSVWNISEVQLATYLNIRFDKHNFSYF